MDEQLQRIIDQGVADGLSDEDIDFLVQEYGKTLKPMPSHESGVMGDAEWAALPLGEKVRNVATVMGKGVAGLFMGPPGAQMVDDARDRPGVAAANLALAAVPAGARVLAPVAGPMIGRAAGAVADTLENPMVSSGLGAAVGAYQGGKQGGASGALTGALIGAGSGLAGSTAAGKMARKIHSRFDPVPDVPIPVQVPEPTPAISQPRRGSPNKDVVPRPTPDAMVAKMARGNADAQASDRMIAGMSQPKPVPSAESMDVDAMGDPARVADLAASRRMIEQLAKMTPAPTPAPVASHAPTKVPNPDYLRQDVVSIKAPNQKGLHLPGESTPNIMQQLMEILKNEKLSPEAQALRTAGSQRLKVSGVIPKAKKTK